MRLTIVAAFALAFAPSVRAQEPQDSTLRGIQSVTITMPATAALTDQQRAAITDAVASDLRRSGLRVATEGSANALVAITVESIHHLMSSDVRVSVAVYQEATIIRLNSTAAVLTWQRARIDTGVSDVRADAQHLTTQLVRDMLDKLLIANGR